MRIVGGKYRSRVLKQFDGDNVRPTSDKVRESLFNILSSDIDDALVLDLFAGTGAVGLEAISRGAREVYFTDKSADSLKIVKDNLSMLNEKATVLRTDSIEFLKSCDKKFDFIFIDPPYKTDLGIKALEVIAKRGLLTEEGIAVFESEMPFEDKIEGLNFYDERKYGRTYLAFFKKKKDAGVFAGTFDPITLGHYDMVIKATGEFEKVYVVLMINPNKTPYFTKEERLSFMKETFKDNNAVIVDSHDGYAVDYLKKVGTPYYIRGIRSESDLAYEEKNAELSRGLYPELKTIYYKALKSDKHVSSTNVRYCIENGEEYEKYLPKSVAKMVKSVVESKIGK